MNSILFSNRILKSQVENEDYFAIKVVYDPSIESSKHVGFYFNDTDLLEFAVDKQTNIIKKFQIVVCNHFEIKNDYLTLNENYQEGSLSINLPPHNDCELFNVQIFKNAVKIILSSNSAEKVIKCGQVLFGLSSENEITEISVHEMSKQNITHTINELQYEI